MSDYEKNPFKKPDIKKFQSWIYESSWASRVWRAQSWRCHELYDGGKAQWTQSDWDKAQDSGIDPLTVNRVFPTINLILGYQVINQFDIVAKGRTHKDAEISQAMTESLHFVMDQYDGPWILQQAFRNQVIGGFGAIASTINPDPRHEKCMIELLDWKEIGWDPFSLPWWSPNRTRYVYKARWMDVDELKILFYEKRKEIEEQFSEFTGEGSKHQRGQEFYQDEGTWVEEYIKGLSGADWADKQRRRIRPVELWYTLPERCLFALFPDGRYVELTDDMPVMDQYQVISQAQEVAAAIVKKVRVCTFFGDVMLQDMASPFPHDQYPIVPLVGYIDRYGFPYGVPFQIEGMQEEVNKRRSMALALLKSRRITADEDVAADQAGLDRLYEEANKLDGFMVLAKGSLREGKFKIHENAELALGQAKLMEVSENEINEIVGANLAAMGYESNETSGVAIEKRQKQAAVLIACLFENLRWSMKRIGEQIGSNVQGFWQGEKVIRVTDRLTGAEKFMEINHRIKTESGEIAIQNNIAQGKFDFIISEVPATDTMKEKNLDLLMSAIQKSPPEAVPILLATAFEMMDLPNKEMIMAHIKQLFNMNPLEEDMSEDQRKQMIMEQMEAQRQEAKKQKDMQEAAIQLDLENKELSNEMIRAEIMAIMGKSRAEKAQAVANIKNNVLNFRRTNAGKQA